MVARNDKPKHPHKQACVGHPALSIGAVVPQIAPKLFAAVPMAPMTQLPLILIPAFLVPTFLMLHVTALLQARRLSR
jgi:hypothetical protein